MTKKICFFILYLFPVVGIASPILALKSRVNINGTVVASTCSIVIDGGSSHQGLIDFGVYNKNGVNHQGVVNKPFTIKFYEKQSTVPGCSAFLAGDNRVTFSFGNHSLTQLDERGVITKGAGNNIRIAIASTDDNVVSNHNKITSNNAVLTYPRDFASKGVFGFMATAEGLNKADAGTYRGALSLVVTYQ